MSADRELRPKSCREFVEDMTGKSTRKTASPADSAAGSTDVWYLVYRDDEGAMHTVKGSVGAIRRGVGGGPGESSMPIRI